MQRSNIRELLACSDAAMTRCCAWEVASRKGETPVPCPTSAQSPPQLRHAVAASKACAISNPSELLLLPLQAAIPSPSRRSRSASNHKNQTSLRRSNSITLPNLPSTLITIISTWSHIFPAGPIQHRRLSPHPLLPNPPTMRLGLFSPTLALSSTNFP